MFMPPTAPTPPPTPRKPPQKPCLTTKKKPKKKGAHFALYVIEKDDALHDTNPKVIMDTNPKHRSTSSPRGACPWYQTSAAGSQPVAISRPSGGRRPLLWHGYPFLPLHHAPHPGPTPDETLPLTLLLLDSLPLRTNTGSYYRMYYSLTVARSKISKSNLYTGTTVLPRTDRPG